MKKDLFSYNNKNANTNNKNANILEEINTHNIYLWIQYKMQHQLKIWGNNMLNLTQQLKIATNNL